MLCHWKEEKLALIQVPESPEYPADLMEHIKFMFGPSKFKSVRKFSTQDWKGTSKLLCSISKIYF